MGQDFLTRSNIGNFTFQMFIVVFATEFTKKLLGKESERVNKISKVKTEWIVFGYSMILSIVNTLIDPTTLTNSCADIFTNIVLTFFNAVIISYFATASYSKIVSNHDQEKSGEKGVPGT